MDIPKNEVTIHAGNTCAEYFKEMVESAVEHQHVTVSKTAEFYVVNLLNECLKTAKVFAEDDPEKEEPLTQKLNLALNASHYEKIKRFKELGDFTLFISGFFPDSLNRKLVDVDYYAVIGSAAYKNLSFILRKKKNGPVFSSLYDELAEKFSSLMGVLSEISRKTSMGKTPELLRIYEKWVKTGNPWEEKLLKKKGIFPAFPAVSHCLH